MRSRYLLATFAVLTLGVWLPPSPAAQTSGPLQGVSPAVAADRLAEERMRTVGRLATIRLPR